MLSQLMGSGVGEITAVVVRYYGGIMLGTGGLVKAYGGGVQTGLRLMARQVKVPKQAFALECQYAQLVETERILKRFQGEIRTRDFQGQVRLIVALPASQSEACATALNDFSRGLLSLRPLVKTS